MLVNNNVFLSIYPLIEYLFGLLLRYYCSKLSDFWLFTVIKLLLWFLFCWNLFPKVIRDLLS